MQRTATGVPAAGWEPARPPGPSCRSARADNATTAETTSRATVSTAAAATTATADNEGPVDVRGRHRGATPGAADPRSRTARWAWDPDRVLHRADDSLGADAGPALIPGG